MGKGNAKAGSRRPERFCSAWAGIRFGRLSKATRAAIEAIDDLDRLERLSERLLTATSWADLLAESE